MEWHRTSEELWIGLKSACVVKMSQQKHTIKIIAFLYFFKSLTKQNPFGVNLRVHCPPTGETLSGVNRFGTWSQLCAM